MRFKTLFTAALLLLGGGAVSAQALLVHNARGLTLDERGRVIRFDAMQVGADGRVLAIGKLNELPAGDMQRVDAGGRVLMPGLIDAHGHVLALGAARRSLQLRDTADLAAALAAVKAHAEPGPTPPGSPAAAGTRRCGSWAASRPRPSWTRLRANAPSG